ncbi:MAG: M15 family metallopeptidase [Eubacterium sp.]|nr:M15 family metallopeptidase [Eubacterium sp.]
MQKKLIIKIVSFYKKHPKKRNTAIAMLFVVVLISLLGKYFVRGIKKYTPRVAIGIAAFSLVLFIPRSITIADDAVVVSSLSDEATELFEGVMSDSDVSDPVNVDLPDKVVNYLPWNLILLNAENPLPVDYSFTSKQVRSGCEVDERIYDSLMEMIEDAASEGHYVFVCSAYRSEDRQYELFETAVTTALNRGMTEEEAYAYAADQYSVPGTSEHQAGLAVDIVPYSQQLLNNALADTEEEQWLMEHCAEYGFILRYPSGRENITGISFEPWHYRYVGVEAATYITENDITLEEYLDEFYPNHVNFKE